MIPATSRERLLRFSTGVVAGSACVLVAYFGFTLVAHGAVRSEYGLTVFAGFGRGLSVWLPIAALVAAGAKSWVLWPTGVRWWLGAPLALVLSAAGGAAGFSVWGKPEFSLPWQPDWALLGLVHGACVAAGYLLFVGLRQSRWRLPGAAAVVVVVTVMLAGGLAACLRRLEFLGYAYSSSHVAGYWSVRKGIGFVGVLLCGVLLAEALLDMWFAGRSAVPPVEAERARTRR
jgi:hypothetical protein